MVFLFCSEKDSEGDIPGDDRAVGSEMAGKRNRDARMMEERISSFLTARILWCYPS
jgi:hypothetical protein